MHETHRLRVARLCRPFRALSAAATHATHAADTVSLVSIHSSMLIDLTPTLLTLSACHQVRNHDWGPNRLAAP